MPAILRKTFDEMIADIFHFVSVTQLTHFFMLLTNSKLQNA